MPVERLFARRRGPGQKPREGPRLIDVKLGPGADWIREEYRTRRRCSTRRNASRAAYRANSQTHAYTVKRESTTMKKKKRRARKPLRPIGLYEAIKFLDENIPDENIKRTEFALVCTKRYRYTHCESFRLGIRVSDFLFDRDKNKKTRVNSTRE